MDSSTTYLEQCAEISRQSKLVLRNFFEKMDHLIKVINILRKIITSQHPCEKTRALFERMEQINRGFPILIGGARKRLQTCNSTNRKFHFKNGYMNTTRWMYMNDAWLWLSFKHPRQLDQQREQEEEICERDETLRTKQLKLELQQRRRAEQRAEKLIAKRKRFTKEKRVRFSRRG